MFGWPKSLCSVSLVSGCLGFVRYNPRTANSVNSSVVMERFHALYVMFLGYWKPTTTRNLAFEMNIWCISWCQSPGKYVMYVCMFDINCGFHGWIWIPLHGPCSPWWLCQGWPERNIYGLGTGQACFWLDQECCFCAPCPKLYQTKDMVGLLSRRYIAYKWRFGV